MRSFGGPSPKPLQIWHTAGLDLSALLRPKPFGLDGGLVAQDTDAGSWTGVKDRLVQSEHYTSEFGAMVLACFEPTVAAT